MMLQNISHPISYAILLTLPVLSMASQVQPTRHSCNLPPSTVLDYSVKAEQSGIPLEGNAKVHWTVSPTSFSLVTQMRSPLLGKILEAKTEGGIDEFGLAPVSFSEKRLRRDATSVSFNRKAKTITYNAPPAVLPLVNGVQDRNSAVWQLVCIARAVPAKFKPGSEWSFAVAGKQATEHWRFKVTRQVKIRTAVGDVNALQIVKTTEDGDNRQKTEIWLAPSMEWYPVRIRYSEPDGDLIEQTLLSITKKPPQT